MLASPTNLLSVAAAAVAIRRAAIAATAAFGGRRCFCTPGGDASNGAGGGNRPRFRRNRRRSPSPLRDEAAAAAAARESARSELSASDLLATRTEETLDRLSGLVASSSPGAAAAESAAAQQRARKAVAARVQAAKYLPAFAAGEASVLLYCAERQVALLHRSDPEVWHAAALADAFPLTEAAARRLLGSFAELHWQRDIQRRDAAIIDRVWPAALRPASAERAGLGWLRSAGKLPLMRFAAGNPDLPHHSPDPDGLSPRPHREPGQMERLVADYYRERCGRGDSQPGFLVQAEAAEAAAPDAAAAAREQLTRLLAELDRLERLHRARSEGRHSPEPFRFKRKLEGIDFSGKFIYDR